MVVDLVDSAYRGERSKAGWTTEAELLGGQRTDAEGIAAVISAADSRVLLASDEHDDLIACCRGDKEITPDLRAVEISN